MNKIQIQPNTNIHKCQVGIQYSQAIILILIEFVQIVLHNLLYITPETKYCYRIDFFHKLFKTLLKTLLKQETKF